MASNLYGSYEEQEDKLNNSNQDEVYYEEDLEKKHLYKEIEFAVDVEDSVVYIIGEIEGVDQYDDSEDNVMTLLEMHVYDLFDGIDG